MINSYQFPYAYVHIWLWFNICWTLPKRRIGVFKMTVPVVTLVLQFWVSTKRTQGFFFVLIRHPIICGGSTVLADAHKWANKLNSDIFLGMELGPQERCTRNSKEKHTGYGLCIYINEFLLRNTHVRPNCQCTYNIYNIIICIYALACLNIWQQHI